MSIRRWIRRLMNTDTAVTAARDPNWLQQAVDWVPPDAVTADAFRAAVEPWMQRVPELRSHDDLVLAAKWLRSIACQAADRGDLAFAQIGFAQCRALLMAMDWPSDPDIQMELAACENLNGIKLYDADQWSEAELHYRRAIRLREGLAPQLDAGNARDSNALYLGGAYCNLGHTLRDLSRYPAARQAYGAAIDLLDQMIPGCDCGCRSMYAEMVEKTRGFSVVKTASRFLVNALLGRQECRRRAGMMESKLSSVRLESESATESEQGVQRICFHADALADQVADAREVRHDALHIVMTAKGPVEFDVQDADPIGEHGIALLHHLRLRLIGEEIWPSLRMTPEQALQPRLAAGAAAFSSDR